MAFWDDLANAKVALDIRRQSGAWFRGVKKGSYKLIPNLLRDGLANNEHNLIARFVRQGNRYLKTTDPWERLAFMQHYGVPTKLLDWSTDLTSSIYFAIAYKAYSEADLECPSIWILNPFRLNGVAEKKLTGNEPSPRKIFDNLDKPPEFSPTGRSGSTWPYEYPIAIAVNWYDPRIENQQGVFTYHGTNTKAIEDIAGECVKKITIADNEAGDLLNHLRNAGITHHRMFQNPESLASDIAERISRSSLLWREEAVAPSYSGASEEEDETD